MTEAMNKTVTSGTPRTNSMKPIDTQRTIGSCERRPSANRMPMGNEAAMPTLATTSVRKSPPHSSVGTCGSHRMPPVTSTKPTIGNTAMR